mgnify:CR=1 FL=1
MCHCQASGQSPFRFRLQMPRRPLCRSSRYSRCHLPEPGVPRWLPGTPRRVLLILSRPGRQLLPLPSRRKSGFCSLQELRSPRLCLSCRGYCLLYSRGAALSILILISASCCNHCSYSNADTCFYNFFHILVSFHSVSISPRTAHFLGHPRVIFILTYRHAKKKGVHRILRY